MRPISPTRSILDDCDTRPEGSVGFVIYLDSVGNYFFSDEFNNYEYLTLGPYEAEEYFYPL